MLFVAHIVCKELQVAARVHPMDDIAGILERIDGEIRLHCPHQLCQTAHVAEGFAACVNHMLLHGRPPSIYLHDINKSNSP